VLVVLAGFGAKSLFSGSRTAAKQDDALAEKLRSVQEELNKKELALAVQEKRLKEMQETPTLATIPSRLSGESPSSGGPDAGKGLASAGKGPLTALQEPEDSESQASARTPGDEEEFEDLAKPAPAEPKSGQSKALSSTEPTPAKPAADSAKSPPVNFDAQAVTAASEGPNTGTLSFKLTKDQPDLRFSGFLFVFVEMTDPRGENKIYAYPKRTRLGDGDLPSNYKDGESLSFKYNSRVELPYSDIRSGAHLERVSILLYGENGKIVFQRGFDRREVKLLGAKGSAMDGTRHRAGDKRRAL